MIEPKQLAAEAATLWCFQLALLCPDPGDGDAIICEILNDPSQIGSVLPDELIPGYCGVGMQLKAEHVDALTGAARPTCIYWVYEWECGPLLYTNHAPSVSRIGENWDFQKSLDALTTE